MTGSIATRAAARRGRHGGRAAAGGLVAAVVLLAAACGGAASPSPSSGGPAGTEGPGVSDEPTAGVTAGPGESSGTAGTGTAAFTAATTALDALDSYAYSVEIQSSGAGGASHTLMTGVVVNKPSKASSLEQATIEADGTKSGETGIILIGDQAWLRNGAPTAPWTEVPASQAAIFVQTFAAYRPEQMFGIYFAGIGGNFADAGSETRNGVSATRYKGDEAVGAILGAIAGVQGTWSSDVWIANDGGYLVRSEASATAGTGTAGGSFSIVVDITEINSAGPIAPPS